MLAPQIDFLIVVVLFAMLVLVTIASTVKVVPQGMNYTVERFGRYTRTLSPGLNVLTPFIERIGRKLSMMEQVMDVPSQEVITRDNASCRTNGVTFYQILDAPRSAYQVADLKTGLLNLTMTNIRSVMGSMDLDELLSNRDEINARVLRVVDAAVEPWGIKITRIEIKDIDPPADLVAAMARQMKAEREKRAVILEAEGERQSAVLKAEGEKQSLILAAEGRQEAAERDATARERLAEAEARATLAVSSAIDAGNLQAINYFVATRYVEAIAAFAASPNQKTFILPLEASAALGSLAGIAGIASEAFAAPKATRSDGVAASAVHKRPAGPVPTVTGRAEIAPGANGSPSGGSVPGSGARILTDDR